MDENEKYMETRSHRKQEMKFSKEICKQCYEQCGPDSWSAGDDESWKEGKVWCVELFYSDVPIREHFIGIGEIPDGCPYKLEHTVMSEKPK